MKHLQITKGQWKVDNDTIVSETNFEETPDGGNIICISPEGFEDSLKRWEANAKLIAAAPELLESLEILCNILQDNPKFTEGSFKNEYDFAMKTIKKATE